MIVIGRLGLVGSATGDPLEIVIAVHVDGQQKLQQFRKVGYVPAFLSGGQIFSAANAGLIET